MAGELLCRKLTGELIYLDKRFSTRDSYINMGDPVYPADRIGKLMYSTDMRPVSFWAEGIANSAEQYGADRWFAISSGQKFYDATSVANTDAARLAFVRSSLRSADTIAAGWSRTFYQAHGSWNHTAREAWGAISAYASLFFWIYDYERIARGFPGALVDRAHFTVSAVGPTPYPTAGNQLRVSLFAGIDSNGTGLPVKISSIDALPYIDIDSNGDYEVDISNMGVHIPSDGTSVYLYAISWWPDLVPPTKGTSDSVSFNTRITGNNFRITVEQPDSGL